MIRHSWPHFYQGIHYEWRRIKRMGLPAIFGKITLKIAGVLVWLFLLPITLIMHIAGYRRVTVFTDRIGHLALEPDCLIKEQSLGLIQKKRWILLAPPGRVANYHLLSYWEQYFLVVRHPWLCFLISNMSKWSLMREDISHYILATDRAQTAYRIFSDWGNRPPILGLSQEDKEWAIQAMQNLGLPRNAWFVCLHVREAGFSPADEELHAHRNASIENAIPAIKAITDRGGWVIRIGDASMKPLPTMPNIIDYAHHHLKSERLDIILCAQAKFMLGNTSGISLVSTIFGVPCALANMIPLSTMWFGARDLCLPKLLWDEIENRYLSFKEIMESEIGSYRYASLFRAHSIRVEENSSEDIRDLAVEMMDKLEGSFESDIADGSQQEIFITLFKKHHYAQNTSSRLGSLFLRKHYDLLS